MIKNLRASAMEWLPVIALSAAAFIFVTTEFIPEGLLPDIANDLSKSIPFTGLIMTIYAWVVATLSLPLTILTARFERRKLLFILLLVFISTHLIAGFSYPGYVGSVFILSSALFVWLSMTRTKSLS
ncbi:MAG: MFS transporter [Pseudobdellovibrio sp.]